MANPRRNSDVNPFTTHHFSSSSSSLLSILINFLKRPHACPLLLSIFVFLTWVSLRLQYSFHVASELPRTQKKWTSNDADDLKANLVRFKPGLDFPSRIAKDKRGWLLNPVSLALESGVKGGAVSCVSVHLGEIRPGGVRGNHRHYSVNETFVIWGAITKFRLENNEIDGKGFAEVIVDADEVAIAASPRGTAHALVNIDSVHSTFFMGCQDGVINYNSSSSDFNVWKDL